ncbi:MAG: hypothetical protein IKQ17_04355 [Kiritimatiellae bacterium]|nr:hypothetical protein [Kiritimatiellia bacterium]
MSRGLEVLVAEDDPVIRRAVKAALASEGYSVRETPDGAGQIPVPPRRFRLVLYA